VFCALISIGWGKAWIPASAGMTKSLAISGVSPTKEPFFITLLGFRFVRWISRDKPAKQAKSSRLSFEGECFDTARSAQIIDTLLELINHSLQNGEDVLISGFGKFSVKSKHGPRGRNPQTGEPLKLSPRKVVTFKCSGVLRAKMNGKGWWGMKNFSPIPQPLLHYDLA
jgi:integration host factor subunit alpha